MSDKPSIAFVCPYPYDAVGSQRFRFEQYFDVLQNKGYSFQQYPLYTISQWNTVKGTPHKLKLTIILFKVFVRRITQFRKLKRFDIIFIHREMFPAGPPFFEWILASILNKKIIYDFDDAIWMNDPTETTDWKSLLRGKSKTSSIIKWSDKVSCGNKYLANYASRFNNNGIINPTTIDTVYHRPVVKNKNDRKTIGWTGTSSTLPYLKNLEGVLKEIETNFETDTLIISDKAPLLKLNNLRFLPWNKESEIIDLNKMDVGLMPLTDDDWSRGKCGFKLLQYMACGIPCLASPVGVNTEIIKDGENGFLCYRESDWFDYIKLLLNDKNMRKKLGNNGRKTVIENYSKTSNQANFLSLFDK